MPTFAPKRTLAISASEVKNSTIHEGAKANHLTYLGDATVGRKSNVGAGTITCNYDGVAKYKTTIGEGVFVGSDSALVAPVRIGNGAYIAAGSIITDNVPPDALAIARGRQTNKPGWAKKQRAARAQSAKGTRPVARPATPQEKIAPQLAPARSPTPIPTPPLAAQPSFRCATLLGQENPKRGRRRSVPEARIAIATPSMRSEPKSSASPSSSSGTRAKELSGFDAVILPGGFSYGDYLRTGAIARFSPVMRAIEKFARSGGLVLGVCNGFQILCEAGLLPGALMRNQRLRFICRHVHVRVETANTPFTCEAREGEVLRLPIAHGEGNYFCDPATLADLERHRQIVFRYVQRRTAGQIFAANPNGSLDAIAGVCNRERNVLGLMPHPERAVELALSSADGLVIFRSLVASLARLPVAAERLSA